jgi:hypothetical protein
VLALGGGAADQPGSDPGESRGQTPGAGGLRGTRGTRANPRHTASESCSATGQVEQIGTTGSDPDQTDRPRGSTTAGGPAWNVRREGSR